MTVVVAVVGLLFLLVGDLGNNQVARWVVLVTVPLCGAIGIAAGAYSARLARIQPEPSMTWAVLAIIANALVLVVFIPLLWFVVVLLGGP